MNELMEMNFLKDEHNLKDALTLVEDTYEVF